jgi:hypothetical protein
MVIAPEGSGTFELGREDEAALVVAIGEANRGEVTDATEFLTKLGPRD